MLSGILKALRQPFLIAKLLLWIALIFLLIHFLFDIVIGPTIVWLAGVITEKCPDPFVGICSATTDFVESPSSIAVTFVENFVATIFIAFLGYNYRTRVRHIIRHIVDDDELIIRSPLMSAAAPLVYGNARGIWQEFGLKADIEWNYAGHDALKDLQTGEAMISVASDFAIAKFLTSMGSDGKDPTQSYSVAPFAALKANLSLVIFNDEVYEKNNKVLYYPNSVHEEYIIRILRRDPVKFGEKTDSLSDMLCRVKRVGKYANDDFEPVGASLVWEPYNEFYADIFGAGSPRVQLATSLEWYLCIMANAEYLKNRPGRARAIRDAVQKSCRGASGARRDLSSLMARSIPEELAGINIKHLERVLAKENNIVFGVNSNFPGYKAKINQMYTEGIEGAREGLGYLKAASDREALWPLT